MPSRAKRAAARSRTFVKTCGPAPAQEQAWQSMRVMRRFTAADILVTASIGKKSLQAFIKGLADAGYLRLAKPRANGRAGSYHLWQLVRDTGPFPPVLHLDGGATDRNTSTRYESVRNKEGTST